MRKVWLSGLIVLSVGGLVPVIGCGRPDDGLTDAQHQTADRLTEIAKKADGDWEKVPQADRDYILKNVAYGNEQQARMIVLAKAGKLKGTPGGPPK